MITPIEIKSTSTTVPSTGPEFEQVLQQHELRLRRAPASELQINLGKLCNLACHHCHVDAGPKRTEIMVWSTMQKVLQWLEASDIKRVDLTGGAPELNPNFRTFCNEVIKLGVEITSRCNITVLFEKGQQDLAQFYADRGIRLVCSLPCYSQDNVDAQRGKGVFDQSIKGLQLLNTLGYGIDPKLPLDLVYNPGGAFLPPPQAALEQDYKRFLREQFGIEFSNLIAITNVPINRFAHALRRDGQLDEYQTTLVDSFNPKNIDGLMCRHLINIDWLGRVYDCDFNQMLELNCANAAQPVYLWDIAAKQFEHKSIATARHCFACTAGAGSSCSGELS